jgi:hypothetical protein
MCSISATHSKNKENQKGEVMKKIILRVLSVMVILTVFAVVYSIAQIQIDTAQVKKLIDVPSGFNWTYILLFVGGMVIHYLKKVFYIAGWKKLISMGTANFYSWFVNKFHWTLLAGAAALILGLTETYGLNISFATINLLGVCASLAAGYIADSGFNQGVIVVPKTPNSNDKK